MIKPYTSLRSQVDSKILAIDLSCLFGDCRVALLLAMTILLSFSACSKLPKQEETKNVFLENLASDENNENYAKAIKVIEFNFPQDHGPHEEFKTEWWYFTGNLKSEKKDFGYQFTIFRNNIAPELELSNDWEAKNIFMGHMGLSDLKDKKFYSFERFERGALGLAGTSNEPFKVWMNHWHIKSANKEIFPLEISAMEDGIGYKLKVTKLKEKVLQGNKGLSQKSKELGNASYYYSYTRLKTEGQVFIKDKTYQVSGLSWMDREWSTSALGKDQVGWDWFSLQLDDGNDLMIYQMRNKDGSIDEYSSGAFVDKAGHKTQLALSDFELKPLETWSNDEGNDFPIKWSLKLPKYNISLTISTEMKNQMHDFSIPYWEGAVKVTGTQTGLGYLEMTGY